MKHRIVSMAPCGGCHPSYTCPQCAGGKKVRLEYFRPQDRGLLVRPWFPKEDNRIIRRKRVDTTPQLWIGYGDTVVVVRHTRQGKRLITGTIREIDKQKGVFVVDSLLGHPQSYKGPKNAYLKTWAFYNGSKRLKDYPALDTQP